MLILIDVVVAFFYVGTCAGAGTFVGADLLPFAGTLDDASCWCFCWYLLTSWFLVSMLVLIEVLVGNASDGTTAGTG